MVLKGGKSPQENIRLTTRVLLTGHPCCFVLPCAFTAALVRTGIIIMVVVMILTSLSVAREREFGTFDQLLVAPFTPVEILVCKSPPGIVFGLMDALLFSAGAVYWFGVPFRGTIPALVLALPRDIFLKGADVSIIWPQLWPLLVLACVTLPLAAWLLRHRSQ
jgi:ABC-type Na+ efflux pump permease subunit